MGMDTDGKQQHKQYIRECSGYNFP